MRKEILLVSIGLLLASPVAQAGALHDAARKGDVAAIGAALDAGADVNEYDGLATPLNHAVRLGHLDAARLLIERGAGVNDATNSWGDSLMMATQKSRIDLIKLLLANGAIANSTHNGEAVLHVAAKFGCIDCVKALVEAGADVNAETYAIMDCISHRTPLHLATLFGYTAIAAYLQAHGATIPKPAPVNSRLAAADAGKGQIYFEQNCLGCHFAEPGQGRKNGPNLWGVVGRDKASLAGANYSKALSAWHGTWTYEDLSTFLYGPMLTVPGVKMETAGVQDESERADLIAYLRTLSHNPAPLP
jgi:cytochrome c